MCHSFSTFISKSGAQPLAAQKPIKIQVCWKEKFILDAGNGVGRGRGEGGLLSKGQLPPTNNQWARAFIGEGRGLHVERTQSVLMSS